MLRALGELFDRALGGNAAGQTPEARKHALQLATAILLVEVARADYEENLTENTVVFDLLRRFFELDDDEAGLLVEEAQAEADHAASLQAFTRELHERLSFEDKLVVVEMLWRVALADRHLDKHEDHLVRKVAGLLYIPHGDLIRLRNRVKDEHRHR